MQQSPEKFEGTADGPCGAQTDSTTNRGQSGAAEQQIDPVPEVDGFRFIDEVGVPGGSGGSSECVFGREVGCRGIFNIGNGDKVLTGPDLTQSTAAGGLQQFGDEMIVSGPPDEMGSKCAGEQSVMTGGCEDSLFGECFGVRVVAEPVCGIWQ